MSTIRGDSPKVLELPFTCPCNLYSKSLRILPVITSLISLMLNVLLLFPSWNVEL